MFVTEDIMNEAGIKEEQKEDGEEDEVLQAEEVSPPALVSPNVRFEELQSALNDAISNENYEEAARLRDEITRLKSSS